MTTETKPRDRNRYRGFETITLSAVVRVGGVQLKFADLSTLKAGTVLTLDARVGSPFELLVGGQRIARVEPIASDGDAGIALKLVADKEEEAGDGSDS